MHTLTTQALDSAIKMFRFKLFHHFQTNTSRTLLYPSELWGHASRLCHEFEFLMDSILCIAARHLAHLQPEEPKYSGAAVHNLCRALSGFRSALSNNLVVVHPDAFVATSILLQFEVWANTDPFLPRGNKVVHFNPSMDPLFSFCSSVKEMFLREFPAHAVQRSFFMHHIRRASEQALSPVSDGSQSASFELQDFLSYDRPVTTDLLRLDFATVSNKGKSGSGQSQHQTTTELQDNAQSNLKGYQNALSQLCIISALLLETRNLGPHSIPPSSLTRLARHVFSFPIMCRGAFASMVIEEDPHALLLLYHLYRAVRILLPSNEYWWTSNRARILESSLEAWIIQACQVKSP